MFDGLTLGCLEKKAMIVYSHDSRASNLYIYIYIYAWEWVIKPIRGYVGRNASRLIATQAHEFVSP